jgi:hypothetical protein
MEADTGCIMPAPQKPIVYLAFGQADFAENVQLKRNFPPD